MNVTVCLVVLGVGLLLCGLALRSVCAITEQEIEPASPEPRIVPMHRTPWKDPAPMIVLDAGQQAELMRIYREEYLEPCVWPEMPLLSFLREVELHQRPDKPIEVAVFFAQQHHLRAFSREHQLGWLGYAVDRAFERKEQLT